MKTKKLIDLKIVVEPDHDLGRYLSKEEWRIEAYEEWARDLQEFIRDHRSQDSCIVTVEREFKEVCEYCGYAWEEDPETGEPLCCQKATDEWETVRAGEEAPDGE